MITERPKAFIYTCDGCGTEHVQENADGHYTDSTPPMWRSITVSRVGQTFHPQSSANSEPKGYLLCQTCWPSIVTALGNILGQCRRDRSGER